MFKFFIVNLSKLLRSSFNEYAQVESLVETENDTMSCTMSRRYVGATTAVRSSSGASFSTGLSTLLPHSHRHWYMSHHLQRPQILLNWIPEPRSQRPNQTRQGTSQHRRYFRKCRKCSKSYYELRNVRRQNELIDKVQGLQSRMKDLKRHKGAYERLFILLRSCLFILNVLVQLQ